MVLAILIRQVREGESRQGRREGRREGEGGTGRKGGGKGREGRGGREEGRGGGGRGGGKGGKRERGREQLNPIYTNTDCCLQLSATFCHFLPISATFCHFLHCACSRILNLNHQNLGTW
jgi:hypothetical protein